MFLRKLNFIVLIALAIVSANADAQVRISTDLPHIIPVNRLLSFEVQIDKGNVGGFAKLEISNSIAFQIQTIDSRSGVSEVSDSTLKIRWEVLPADSVLSLRLKILPVQDQKSMDLIFKFSYNADDVGRDFFSYPYRVVFTDNVLPLAPTPRMEPLRSAEEPAIPIPNVNAQEVVKKSPAEIEQQVAQLKRDALRAFTVGELEKGRVSIRLDSINRKIQMVGDTVGNPAKQSELAALLESKSKLQDDLAVADRVLILARTLNAQADEIMRISREHIAVAQKPKSEKGSTKTKSETTKPESKQAVTKDKSENSTNLAQLADKGLVFKVQLGAFREAPEVAVFRKAGKVVIVNDDGVFKALHGSYTSKQEAAERRTELLQSFPDCFVVAYQDGLRMK